MKKRARQGYCERTLSCHVVQHTPSDSEFVLSEETRVLSQTYQLSLWMNVAENWALWNKSDIPCLHWSTQSGDVLQFVSVMCSPAEGLLLDHLEWAGKLTLHIGYGWMKEGSLMFTCTRLNRSQKSNYVFSNALGRQGRIQIYVCELLQGLCVL